MDSSCIVYPFTVSKILHIIDDKTHSIGDRDRQKVIILIRTKYGFQQIWQRYSIIAAEWRSFHMPLRMMARTTMSLTVYLSKMGYWLNLNAMVSDINFCFQNSTEPNCHQAVLFFTKVTSVDVGEYNFIVRSSVGVSEGSFHVNVTYANGYEVLQEKDDLVSDDTTRNSASISLNVIISILLHYCYYWLS